MVTVQGCYWYLLFCIYNIKSTWGSRRQISSEVPSVTSPVKAKVFDVEKSDHTKQKRTHLHTINLDNFKYKRVWRLQDQIRRYLVTLRPENILLMVKYHCVAGLQFN